ncbi:CRISPR-associated helicase/endonuclease Cas3 [Nitrosomonas sp. Nm33]|uniref:CRISPR-associated helicase/endonuclease Cas3 n=1 Tax=Nitrosomonas sp. Nm33 TaxID=133724 RepID=UPI00089508D7|nr:CRISPR-associated helicase/endonuclease Cas3 [Nitrosomonas sp. Nm33]SDX92327.1 CRISPR-associated endonuclease/helicase Cas3 [Nitrosomonas sp. Nm33]
MEQSGNTIFNYWGKADPNYPDEQKWHPLPYHCLDVASVAAAWWDTDPTIQRTFLAAFGCTQIQQNKLRAWILFFIALHDLGKFDLRFQLKAPNALAAAWRPLGKEDHGVSARDITGFDHGWAGMAWANQEYRQWVSHDNADCEIWEIWKPWLAAVTGHHGDFCEPTKIYAPEADAAIIAHDRNARQGFIFALANIFLTPEGLGFQDSLPFTSPSAQHLLAGFCAVCDWIGSNTDVFEYQKPVTVLTDYFVARVEKIQAGDVLHHFGLVVKVVGYKGVSDLLMPEESPRGVQVQVDNLPTIPGLTLIEAPTGSGKTEAALAYAWRLLDQGMANSIVFALPTQATANAMLTRVEVFAEKVFGNANVVLAHGKSKLNSEFGRMVIAGQRRTAQGKEEASVQCAAWLASSRKRVFLGQIGVCTVDQVLLSVLPVRHKFVRGFGLNKSVLIVDEVHAYDAYMNGLLGEVLRRQRSTGGSAILLSATLPVSIRTKLLEAWESCGVEKASYPALWHATQNNALCTTVPDEHRPERREVITECIKLPGAIPNDDVMGRIIAAAESGAKVAVVMNLVDDAQQLARKLRGKTTIDVDVFHARYRFMDRQKKETATLAHYGRNAERDKGRILVATQVVEQSLDLDFDWMLTQICPVDLLFQRLGRLHRHRRESRPAGFELPRCTVLSVEGEDYGLHKLIYGNTRVLWRTEQLLAGASKIVFPEAYRDWIEQVYQRDDWINEPEKIALGYDEFSVMQRTREANALQLITMTAKAFRDEEAQVTGLTRDGEMSLTVLPIQPDKRLLNGQVLSALNERDLAETLNLHATPVPASWEKWLKDCRLEKEGNLAGYRQLEMCADEHGGWLATGGKFRYSEDFGLEGINDEST